MDAMSPNDAPIDETDSISQRSNGFPLRTALLFIIIFTICGVYSCYYHYWEKVRRLRQSLSSDVDNNESNSNNEANSEGVVPKPMPEHMDSEFEQNQSLPVIMPGDRIATFIAKPCPCQPPRLEKTNNIQLPKPPIVQNEIELV